MFFKIPAETYLEIQTASRRKTKFLLFFLVVIYFIFFFLLFEVTRLFAPHLFSFSFDLGWLEKLILILTFSFLISYIHFKKTVDTIIPGLPYLLGAKNPDPDDFYHKTFSNVVSELSNATGIYNIRSGIMPSTSTNAFSISNGKNYNFVCTTEGLLARLNRNELEAVMAHEFSHILNGDSVLATIACSLFSIFEQILENTKKKNLGLLYKLTSRRFYLFRLYLVILRLLCYIAIFLGQIVTIFISRQRELLADATAVKLTRNPLGLAEALYKISQKWRGEEFVVKGLSPLFIMNPYQSKLDEEENFISDLFSTHPPLSVRLKILLGFAKENISVLQKPETPKYKIIDEMPMWWVAEGAKWLGPYSIDQIKVIDGISPLTWICKDGTNEVRRLKDEPGLSGFFPTETVQGEIYLCPRCNRNLVRRKFEETSVYFCIYCKGHLVSEDNFLKILVRQDAPIYRETIKEVESLSKKDVRGKSPSQLDSFPQCRCPKCGLPMAKVFHSYTTFIVVDKCKSCDLIWFDEKELEYINSLVAL